MLYNINELRIGLKVIQSKEPCVIIGNEPVKPGKGQSFNRIRFKQIISGKILERTLKSGDFLESADVTDMKLLYMYRSGVLFYFMDGKSFEQISIDINIIGESIKWIVEQFSYTVTFWNNKPILVTPPSYVQLKVIKTMTISKNFIASTGNKLATVSTGAIIKVPFFIKKGELIKVNTHLGTYISRIK